MTDFVNIEIKRQGKTSIIQVDDSEVLSYQDISSDEEVPEISRDDEPDVEPESDPESDLEEDVVQPEPIVVQPYWCPIGIEQVVGRAMRNQMENETIVIDRLNALIQEEGIYSSAELPCLIAALMEEADDTYLSGAEKQYCVMQALTENTPHDGLVQEIYAEMIYSQIIEAIIQVSLDRFDHDIYCPGETYSHEDPMAVTNFTKMMVTGRFLTDAQDTFDLIVRLMREVNHLDISKQDKKVFTLSVLMQLSKYTPELFPYAEDKALQMQVFTESCLLWGNFIDVIIAVDRERFQINNKFWLDKCFDKCERWLDEKIQTVPGYLLNWVQRHRHLIGQ